MKKTNGGYLFTKREYWLINLVIVLEFVAFAFALLFR